MPEAQEKFATLMFEMVKHNLAVTCVDWILLEGESGLQDAGLIAVCSDDKIFRLYKHDLSDHSFKLFREECVNSYTDFLTLTYLALQSSPKPYLYVTSQKGHLFVYDYQTGDFVFDRKIHQGGIEGVSLQEGDVWTCSSDNTINRVRF